MESWKVVVEAQRSGMDLRDPKIVTFGSAVMVFCGGRRADAASESLMFQSSDGVIFGDPVRLYGIPDGRWLWHVQPFGDRFYGTAYCCRNGEYAVSLYASDNVLAWERLTDFTVPGNGVYLDFDRDGILWSLVRDDLAPACPLTPEYASGLPYIRGTWLDKSELPPYRMP